MNHTKSLAITRSSRTPTASGFVPPFAGFAHPATVSKDAFDKARDVVVDIERLSSGGFAHRGVPAGAYPVAIDRKLL